MHEVIEKANLFATFLYFARTGKSLDIPFTDPKSKDIWVQMAAAQSKSIEEAIDLSWIDMNAADPKHNKAAHRNARLSPIWTREEHIEMDGLFARGCLIKRNRRDLPTDTRIIVGQLASRARF